MSQENVELVRRAIQSLNDRDLGGFLALMDDKVESAPLLARIEGGYRGHDGMRRWWAALLDSFPDFALEVVRVDDLNEATLAALRVRGRGALGDVPFELAVWHLSLWRHGKCILWRVYDNEPQALEAVGLSG